MTTLLRAHDYELKIASARYAITRTEERAALKQALTKPHIRTAADLVRYKRIGYSAAARLSRMRAEVGELMALAAAARRREATIDSALADL